MREQAIADLLAKQEAEAEAERKAQEFKPPGAEEAAQVWTSMCVQPRL